MIGTSKPYQPDSANILRYLYSDSIVQKQMLLQNEATREVRTSFLQVITRAVTCREEA